MSRYLYDTGDIVAYTIDNPLLILQRSGYYLDKDGAALLTQENYLVLNLLTGRKVTLPQHWIDNFTVPYEQLTRDNPHSPKVLRVTERKGLDNPEQLLQNISKYTLGEGGVGEGTVHHRR